MKRPSGSIPWFRQYVAEVDDPTLHAISAKLFRQFVFIRCLAGENKQARGIVPSLDVVAFRLRVSKPAAQKAIDELLELGLLESDIDGLLSPRRWDEEQFVSDDVTERTRKFREKQRQNVDSWDDGNVSGNVPQHVYGNVREKNRKEKERDTEGDQDGDGDSEREKNRWRARVSVANATADLAVGATQNPLVERHGMWDKSSWDDTQSATSGWEERTQEAPPQPIPWDEDEEMAYAA